MVKIGTAGVTQIIEDIRVLTDNTSSATSAPVFSDAQITRILTRASNRLYSSLSKRGIPYFTTELTFTLAEGVSEYILPTDFYQILSLYVTKGASYYLVREGALKGNIHGYKTGERHGYTTDESKTWIVFGRADNDVLVVVPQSRASGDYTLVYIPEPPAVENLRVPKAWSDFLVYKTAFELSTADYNESLVAMWKSEADQLASEIESWSLNRSPLSDDKIQRIQNEDLRIEEIGNPYYYGYGDH